MTALVEWGIVAAIVGYGVVSGILLIFSNTVMPALDRQGPDAGTAAMVAINEVILNPLFFLFFIGMALLSVGLIAAAFLGHTESKTLVAAGGLLYLVGVFGITAAFNVPMNDALAAVTIGTDEARAYWDVYMDRWVRWNTIRSFLGIAATALLAIAH